MTAQEQQMIQSLADRINGTPLAEKDPDAEQFLQQALGRNPDALYILAQTTLVQQYALEQAQKQLADARAQVAEARAQLDQQRQQAEQPRHAGSFLGNLLGRHDEAAPPPPQGYPQQYTPVPDYSQPGRPYTPGGSSFSGPNAGSGYAPVPPPPPYGQPQFVPAQYGQPPFAQPQFGQPQFGQPQSGGFLRSAMQTAAGVAAGALAFEGIESLMHGFGGPSGGYGMGGYGIGGGRPEEIINNNYYGDASPEEHKELSPDIEDRRGEASGFDDAVDRGDHNFGKDDLLDPAGTADNSDTGADDATFDDNSGDDSGSDDFGSDDSSGFDDGN